MSVPVKEQITQHIETTLKGVHTANGNSYTLDVSRYTTTEKYVPKHLKAVVYQDGEERNEEDNNKDSRCLRIAVDVFIQPPPEDPTPVDTYANTIEAEIVKRLYEDYTRGGLAVDTTCDPADPFATFGEADGFTLLIKVKYRTVYGDPYTVVG